MALQRINWDLLHDCLKLRKCSNKPYYFEDTKPENLVKFVKSFINEIENFSKSSPNKVRNHTNNFLNRLLERRIDDRYLNPANWVGLNHDLPHQEMYRRLYAGTSPYMLGPLPYLISCYIYLNLLITDFKHFEHLRFKTVDDFYSSDNYLPEFLTSEFREINSYIIYPFIKTKNRRYNPRYCRSLFTHWEERDHDEKHILAEDEIKRIKDFCGVLLRCIYISNGYCYCTSNEVLMHLIGPFEFRKREFYRIENF